MVRDYVSELLEPEFGESSQHFAFALNRRRQYAIESGNPIGRNNQQALVVDFVDVTNFATAMQFQIRQ